MAKRNVHFLIFTLLAVIVLTNIIGCFGRNSSRINQAQVQVFQGENLKAAYLIRPIAIATDTKGNIYVLDRYSVTGFIKKFDQKGNFIKSFASLGAGDNQLQTPNRIALDSRDNLYITDGGGVTGVVRKRKLQKYDSEERFQENLVTFPNIAQQTGYHGPTGISIVNDAIYLTNVDRIQKINLQGKITLEFGHKTSGLFGFFLSDYIYGPDSVTADKKGNIYVLDTYSGLIRIFNSTGKLLSQIEPRAVEVGEPLNGDIEIVNNNLFFLDTGLGQLSKFTLQGKLIWRVGSKGHNQHQFFNPTDVHIDGQGFIYIADSGNRCIKKLDSQGKFLQEIGKPSPQAVFFSQPGAVIVEKAIYVADTGNNRVVKLNQKSETQMIIAGEDSSRANLGEIRGKLFYPSGLGLDSKGNIYIVDYDFSRKQKFTKDGKLLFAFGPEGDIALDRKDNIYLGNGIYVLKFNPKLQKIMETQGADQEPLYNQGNLVINRQGEIFMVDRANSRIKKFSSSGKLLTTFGRAGSRQGEFLFPNGIALGSDGNIYVADAGNHRIQVFNSGGEFLRIIGGFGSRKGEFNFPQGVAVDPEGNLYVADTDNQRIVRINKVTRR